MATKSNHQIFVSYKSENANLVRRVVDTLLSNGMLLWFVEYDLPLGSFSLLEDEIRNAIFDSDFALLFLDRAWFTSDFIIEKEARWLEEAKNKHGIKPLVVKLEDDLSYPKGFEGLFSGGEPEIRYNGDLTTLIHWVGENSMFDYSRVSFPSILEGGEKFHIMEGGSFNTGKLIFNPEKTKLRKYELRREENPALQLFFSLFFPRRTYHLVRCFDGTVSNKKIRLVVLFYPFNAVTFNLLPEVSLSDNQIETYFKYRKYAEKWVENNGWEDRGAHILMYEGSRNFGFTYFVPANATKDQIGGWERHYVLGLRRGQAQKIVGEIQFVFFCEQPKDLESFYHVCPYLEDLVCSLEFDPEVVYSKLTRKFSFIWQRLLGLVFGAVIIYDLVKTSIEKGFWSAVQVAFVYLIIAGTGILFVLYLIGELQVVLDGRSRHSKDDRSPFQRAITIFIVFVLAAFFIRYLLSLLG